jgi:DNA-directed RNA polymerase subunit alpha
MISVKKTKITRVETTGNLSTFSISPLPKGYGHTFGTALRRVLLSSIASHGITSVKINGVTHEFSTLSGVSDDILSVLLSLKNIAFKVNTLEPVELYLRKKGSGKDLTPVLASDFEKNSKVEIVNPDYVITHINSDVEIELSITIERGYGYILNNEAQREEVENLPLDPSFSPIKLVNYTVGSARVGKDTELDDLLISITTDGTLSPDEALTIALDILKESFVALRETSNDIIEPNSLVIELDSMARDMDTAKDEIKTKTNMPVSEMKLSTRLLNTLTRAGINDFMQLSYMTESEIENIRGLGSKSYLELLDILKEYNIKLKSKS